MAWVRIRICGGSCLRYSKDSGVVINFNAAITDDANFIFDLGADSMQSLELVAGFEEEFDIELDQDRALEIQSIDKAVDFISEYL